MAVGNSAPEELSVLQAAKLDRAPAHLKWLVQDIWAHQAVGIIGGPPKSCKTWLGLDLAISVASASPCLGTFPVHGPGPVLIYLAEDALIDVRHRIDSICEHRGLGISSLDLHVVDAPSLRLDLQDDRCRLRATLERLRPALLLLDPLVRLHRLDENSSADISRLLGYLRGLQRHFRLAVALVHHMTKRSHGRPGQALRGSGDIHAWADSSAYLLPQQDRFLMTVEHRSAPARDPVSIKLLPGPDGIGAHLEVAKDFCDPPENNLALPEAIRSVIKHSPAPITRTALRRRLKINNKRLGDALLLLEQRKLIRRDSDGWVSVSTPANTSQKRDDLQLELV